MKSFVDPATPNPIILEDEQIQALDKQMTSQQIDSSKILAEEHERISNPQPPSSQSVNEVPSAGGGTAISGSAPSQPPKRNK